MNRYTSSVFLFFVIVSCVKPATEQGSSNSNLPDESKAQNELIISKSQYHNQLYGFWLGSCIGNWTGLITEMDKIGNIGEIKTGPFYTRADWGKADQPSIWAEGIPSTLSETIDFIYADKDSIWGADDDTDIEYMYQHLMIENQTTILTGSMIKEGWLKHIKTEEENFLWVSNQKAFDLMQDGALPPGTSNPELNEHFDMIDAQLTTEIFGLFAPGNPEVAKKISHLPIRTVARKEAAWISEFYVSMYALAAQSQADENIKERIFNNAAAASTGLPIGSYALDMYHFVKQCYDSEIPWEAARDSIYQRYQVNQTAGYDISSRNLYCNGCFAAGINFAASLVSLFYGEGDFKETIKIGSLAGWDSDNPTSTWGGMIGFMIGKTGLESIFGTTFSNKFNIHRTRQNFSKDGIDTFENMASKGILITEKVILELLHGKIDSVNQNWIIPLQY